MACLGIAFGGGALVAPAPVAAARPIRTDLASQVVSLSDDGRYALTFTGTNVNPIASRFDRDTGAVVALPGTISAPGARLSGDGRYVATGGLARYEVATGAFLTPTLQDPTNTTLGGISADGAVLVGHDHLGGVLVWRPPASAPVRIASAVPHTGSVASFDVTSVDRAGTVAAASLWNPVACPTEVCTEVWLLDLVGANHRVVSVGARGQIGAGATRQAALSGDARHLAWISDATNLIEGVGPRAPRVYLRDLLAGTIRVLGTSEFLIGISDDGRRVAYRDLAGSLRLADLDAGVARSVELLVQPTTPIFPPVLSRDGSSMAWIDLLTEGSHIVDPAAAPATASLPTTSGLVPAGTPVAAPRPATWLPARDIGNQGATTQFGYDGLYDLTEDGAIGLVAKLPFGETIDMATFAGLPMGGYQVEYRISGDGRYVINGPALFDRIGRTTVAPTLPPGDPGQILDLSFDGARVLVRRGPNGAQELSGGPVNGSPLSLTQGLPGGTVGPAALSADGGTAVFAWHPGPACASVVACATTLFVADVATGTRQALADGGVAVSWPAVSRDGRRVAWLEAEVSGRVTRDVTDGDLYRLRWMDRSTGITRTLLYDVSVLRIGPAAPLRMSGDGMRLATVRELGSLFIHQTTVALVDLETDRVHSPVRTTDGRTASAAAPVLSADGRTLGFSSSSAALTAARQSFGMLRNSYVYTIDLGSLAGLGDPAGFERIGDQRPEPAVPPLPAFTPAEPLRLLDTRTTTGGHTGRLAAGETITLPIAGTNNIPTDAAAVVANITAVDPTNAGYLTVYPCGTERPTASNVNYRTGDIIPNLTITKLATNGTICIYAHQPTDLIVDLAGWYPA